MRCFIINFIPLILSIWARLFSFETMSSRDCRINKLKDLETIEASLIWWSTVSSTCVNDMFWELLPCLPPPPEFKCSSAYKMIMTKIYSGFQCKVKRQDISAEKIWGICSSHVLQKSNIIKCISSFISPVRRSFESVYSSTKVNLTNFYLQQARDTFISKNKILNSWCFSYFTPKWLLTEV